MPRSAVSCRVEGVSWARECAFGCQGLTYSACDPRPRTKSMIAGLIGLGSAALLVFALTIRDPALPRGGARIVVRASWPVIAAVFAFFERSTTARLGMAAVILAISVGTLGRPALIMDRALTNQAQADPSLTRRKAAGYIALVLAAGTAAALETWRTS